MSRDLGYTPPPINIIKNNYPKKYDYRLKLRIYNHFRSKNAYVKLNLKILSRRGIPGVLGSRRQTRMGQNRPTQLWPVIHQSKGNLMLIIIHIRNMVWKTIVQKILGLNQCQVIKQKRTLVYQINSTMTLPLYAVMYK